MNKPTNRRIIHWYVLDGDDPEKMLTGRFLELEYDPVHAMRVVANRYFQYHANRNLSRLTHRESGSLEAVWNVMPSDQERRDIEVWWREVGLQDYTTHYLWEPDPVTGVHHKNRLWFHAQPVMEAH